MTKPTTTTGPSMTLAAHPERVSVQTVPKPAADQNKTKEAAEPWVKPAVQSLAPVALGITATALAASVPLNSTTALVSSLSIGIGFGGWAVHQIAQLSLDAHHLLTTPTPRPEEAHGHTTTALGSFMNKVRARKKFSHQQEQVPNELVFPPRPKAQKIDGPTLIMRLKNRHAESPKKPSAAPSFRPPSPLK